MADRYLHEGNAARAGDGDRSAAQLARALATQTAMLLRQEIALAKAELSEKGRGVAAGVVALSAAVVLGLLCAAALSAAAILALAMVVDSWLAALIVGGAFAVLTGSLVALGMAQTKRFLPPVPQQTAETLKEDAEWIKARARSEHR
jgi:hypothetical protein